MNTATQTAPPPDQPRLLQPPRGGLRPHPPPRRLAGLATGRGDCGPGHRRPATRPRSRLRERPLRPLPGGQPRSTRAPAIHVHPASISAAELIDSRPRRHRQASTTSASRSTTSRSARLDRSEPATSSSSSASSTTSPASTPAAAPSNAQRPRSRPAASWPSLAGSSPTIARFENRRLDWASEAGVDPAELEPGDHLLRWGPAEGRRQSRRRSSSRLRRQRVGRPAHPARRYCHHTDEAELNRLVAGMSQVETDRYRSDGPGGRQNLYSLLRAVSPSRERS